jgi:hypothetical protein
MIRRALRFGALLVFANLALCARADAQAFKVDKFDIKGEGGTDYVTAEAGTGRVFVSRSTHVMVVDGATGRVVGDIPDTPASTAPGLRRKRATVSRRMVEMRPSRCSI